MPDNQPPSDPDREEVVVSGNEGRTSPKADFIASLCLMLVGAFAFVYAYRMPSFEANWGSYAKPGFPPMFFSAVLILGSFGLFVRSIREGGYRFGLTAEGAARFLRDQTTMRFIMFLLLVAGYFALLNLRSVHFVLKTGAFLFCAMYYYKAAGWLKCLITAMVTALFVWAMFYLLFSVPLP